MLLTTVRVRPCRSEVLADKGISKQGGRQYACVTVFGETVAVASINGDNKPKVEWKRDDFATATINEAVKGALGLMQLASKAGIYNGDR